MTTTTGVVTAVDRVLNAATRDELFGTDDDVALKTYRRLSRQVHPDRCSDARASQAFDHLQALWTGRSATKTTSGTVSTKKHDYTLGKQLCKDDIANLYSATYDDGRHNAVIKIVRDPKNAEMMAIETRALKILDTVPDRFRAFYPIEIEAFRHRDAASGKTRASTVFEPLSGFYTLDEVRDAYPNGIDGRDAAWMFRRLLVAIGNAHDVGIVHGAVTPENVLIHPDQHGLVLHNWVNSVAIGSPLATTSATYFKWLPSYVREKKDVGRALDTYLAAKTMRHLTPEPRLRAFFQGCMVSAVPSAAELLDEFDELLLKIYGPPRFHAFAMPERKDA